MTEKQIDKEKLFTVTVGIPAYNEENNISYLLDSILRQKGENFIIEKIIVLADGCADATEEKVFEASQKSSLIKLIAGKERKGKAARLNELYRSNASDILITFDADILLCEENIIEKMAGFFSDDKVDVVAGNGRPMADKGAVEKIIIAGEQLWYETRKDFKNGDNIYNSGGCAFALRKSFIEKLHFPSGTIAEQEFIYLTAKKSGGKFIFAKNAKVYYRMPDNFKDFFIQIGHLKKKHCITDKYFGALMSEEYVIPFSFKLMAAAQILKKHSFYGILALCLQIVVKIIPAKENDAVENGIWTIAKSTKIIKTGGDKERMRVVFLDFDDLKNPLLAGGQAKATFEVCRRLIKKGFQFTVISSKFPGCEDRIEAGIQYKHIGLGSGNIRLNNIFYILSLPFFVRKIKADLIVECFTAPISTLFTPIFTRIPVTALSTSFEAERFSKDYHLPFWLIEKYGLRLYKYFIAFTKHYDDKIKKENPFIFSKVINLGVDESLFEIQRKKPRHILYLGRLDIGQKGIDLLLKAYAEIKGKINYPLIIAGGGPDEAKVRLIIKNLKLEDKVKMIGQIQREEKKNILSESLCVALPSRNETFCLSALEALAAGAPVTAFDIPGISWADEKIVLKAKPFSISEYSVLLLRAADEKINKKMSVAGRNFARQFSWDNAADNFGKFFKEVIAKSKKIKTETPAQFQDSRGIMPEISVGLPAYNEEKNIQIVLTDVLGQKQKNWKLKEIIVFCDGCDDKTAARARLIKNKHIKVIENNFRRGKSFGINEICREARGDILVFFDADVRLASKDVIMRLVEQLEEKKAMLVGGNARPFLPKTFFERAVYSTFFAFDFWRTRINKGRNLFTCNGGCLAMAREFAKKIKIPQEVRNDDTYLYFVCRANGYNYEYAKDAVVYYKLPKKLDDYLRQVFRSNPESAFFHMKKYFSAAAKEEYRRPPLLYFKSVVRSFLADPLPAAYIILIMLICRPFFRIMSKRYKLQWWSAKSTK